ncbi:MAG: hypothetical protein WBW49_01725, partial [Candidatus Acidiferrum sp.]
MKRFSSFRTLFVGTVVFLAWFAGTAAGPATSSQQSSSQQTPSPAGPPTRADLLRGAYGPYRANNHLLSYDLDVRVNPEKKTISGNNTIRFRMLQDSTRLQLDLHPALQVDKILQGVMPLQYVRDSGAVFVDFPETLHAGQD